MGSPSFLLWERYRRPNPSPLATVRPAENESLDWTYSYRFATVPASTVSGAGVMARKPVNTEFLEKLFTLSGLQTRTDFEKVCDKAPGNMSQYLNGVWIPGERFLKSCLTNYMRNMAPPSFSKIVEISDLAETQLPQEPGVYVILDSSAKVLYIGQATNFNTEVNQTLKRRVPVGIRVGPALKKGRPFIRDMAKYVSLYRIDNKALQTNIEALLLRISINSTHNSNIGHFRP
jgi:hypothetical protein